MYIGVPVSPILAFGSLISTAKPKSAIFIVALGPLSDSSMFSGFKSRMSSLQTKIERKAYLYERFQDHGKISLPP